MSNINSVGISTFHSPTQKQKQVGCLDEALDATVHRLTISVELASNSVSMGETPIQGQGACGATDLLVQHTHDSADKDYSTSTIIYTNNTRPQLHGHCVSLCSTSTTNENILWTNKSTNKQSWHEIIMTW